MSEVRTRLTLSPKSSVLDLARGAQQQPAPPIGRAVRAKAIKVQVGLDPAGVIALGDPASAQTTFVVLADGMKPISVMVNSKAVRKALAVLRENDPATCFATIQGRLMPDGSIGEAGLQVGVKAAKPAADAGQDGA